MYNLHLPAWQGNNSDDLKPCSQFPNLFSAGFCPSGRNENHPKFGIYIFHWLWRWGVAQYILTESVGSRACSEENDGGSALPLEGEGGKKICPYCFQQLSWHALSRHIRDMHRSDAGVTGLKRYFCALTPYFSFAAARPMLIWWCASTAWKPFGIRIPLVATYGGDISSHYCFIFLKICVPSVSFVIVSNNLRFHKRGKELITKERGYQVSKVQQQSYEQTERASHFQEPSSALPSLTFQTSGNNGNETE